jgi:hypothetical protein
MRGRARAAAGGLVLPLASSSPLALSLSHKGRGEVALPVDRLRCGARKAPARTSKSRCWRISSTSRQLFPPRPIPLPQGERGSGSAGRSFALRREEGPCAGEHEPLLADSFYLSPALPPRPIPLPQGERGSGSASGSFALRSEEGPLSLDGRGLGWAGVRVKAKAGNSFQSASSIIIGW